MIFAAQVLRTRLGERTRALFARVKTLGDSAEDTGADTDDVEVLQPLGLFARPKIRRSLEALIVELGEEVLAIALGDKGAGVLNDVEEGETRVYSAADGSCRVRLRADGSIDVEAKSGAAVRITASGGANIVLNGGSLDVARKTDAVSPSTDMTTWMTSVATAINALAPLSVAPPVPVSFATITGGNTTVKA